MIHCNIVLGSARLFRPPNPVREMKWKQPGPKKEQAMLSYEKSYETRYLIIWRLLEPDSQIKMPVPCSFIHSLFCYWCISLDECVLTLSIYSGGICVVSHNSIIVWGVLFPVTHSQCDQWGHAVWWCVPHTPPLHWFFCYSVAQSSNAILSCCKKLDCQVRFTSSLIVAASDVMQNNLCNFVGHF